MKRYYLIMFLTSLLLSSCDLDSNLFNPITINEYKLPGNNIPDSLIERVTFNSEGNTLYGFWVRSFVGDFSKTILYCHGNKHHLDEYWDRVMILHEMGFNVFIFDYRGFGMSEGKSSEAGLYADGRAALDYIRNVKKVPDNSLGIYGFSLGNVVSIYLAARIVRPYCLIAEAPFASANSLTQGSTVLDIPEGWLTTGKFNNVEMVKEINTRFLLLHGTHDDFVRYQDNGKLVYEAAPEGPKELILVEGANHSDIPFIMGEEKYRAEIQKQFN